MKTIKNNLSIALALAFFATTSFAEDNIPSKLEISDPDFAGGSYSAKVELAKKVNELSDVQMTDDQTNSVKNVLLNKSRSIVSPYTEMAIPVTRSIPIKFASGITPPIVRLSSNLITTIVFSDGMGNPWNIRAIAYNKELFSDGTLSAPISTATQLKDTDNIDEVTDEMPFNNILTLEPLNPFAYSNIAITLEGLDQPVILMLASGQKEVDVRVDARISGISPTAKAVNSKGFNSSISGASLDDISLQFVDGTPPTDAEKLTATSSEIEAWLYDGFLIVRTDKQIIYPSYKSAVTSASGISVYRFDSQTQSIALGGGINQTKTIFIEKQ